MGACCSAPAGARGGEAVSRGVGGSDGADPHTAAPARSEAGSAAAAAPLPRPSLGSTSAGYYSPPEGSSEDEGDVWHDALSDLEGVDALAEALEEWEEQQRFHEPGVDAAIRVLKAHGHLLPPDVEAAAREQRAEDRAAAEAVRGTAEAVARVQVHAAPPPALKLERTRSQQLRGALEQPAAADLLRQAAQLAGEGRVLGAHATLAQLAEAAGGSLAEVVALPPDALAPALAPGASLDAAQLVADTQFVQEALDALADHTGWMCSRSDALKVHYRHQRGTTVHSLKFSAVFDHPLEHLLALAHEFDLIVTWNKFSLASLMLAEPSIFESFVYGAQWMMRPFKPMQALLHCRGFDLADEEQCLLVAIQDCAPERLPDGHKPLPKEWGRRKTVNFLPGSCLKLRPLPAAPDGTPRTEGSLLLHLDPHIPFIPAFLLNFVLGVLAPYVYAQMQKVLDSSFADEAGAYSQRIRDQPHLYTYVEQRIAQYSDLLR